MSHEEFRNVLQGAISGNQDDVEKLLKMYSPLVNRSSHIQGKLDEDLRQYILMHIVKNISKFKI